MKPLREFSPEQRLRLFAENATDYAIILLDADGLIVDWSAGAEHLLGWTAAEALNHPWSMIFTDEDQACGMPEAELQIARLQGRAADIRWHRRKNNSRIFADCVTSAIAGPDGTVIGFGKIIRDLTNRKLAHDNATEQANLLEQSYEAAFSWQLDTGEILYWNQAAHALYGYSKEEVRKHSSHELFATLFPENLQAVKQALRDNGHWEGMLSHTIKSGQRIFVASRMALHKDQTGTSIVLETNRDITDQKRIEESVQTSEERFRSLVTASSQIVWLTDADGSVVEDSPSWRKFTGQSYDEWKGFGWLNAIHLEDREKTFRDWHTCVSSRSIFETEYRVRRADGEYRWTSVRGVPILNPDGSIREWIGANTDITQRKLLEIERQRFVSLAEHSTDFIGMADLQAMPFYINPAGMSLVGLDSLQQTMQTPVADFFFPEDRSFILNEFLPKAIQSGTGETEIRFRHFKTGEAIWMIYSVFVIHDGDGVPCAHATVSRNITERKRAEAALLKSEAHLNSLFEQTAVGICETDLTGRVVRVNQRYCQIVQRKPEEILGQRMQDFTHPEDLPHNLALFQNAIKTGAAFEIEKRYLLPDGQTVWVSNTVSFIHTGGNQPVQSILAVSQDITQRKQAEEELRLAARRKDEFLAMLAHELRNPLAPISSAAELIGIMQPAADQLKKTSQIITRQVRHMTGLIDDLLDVSRVTRGLVTIEKNPQDLKEIVSSAVEQMQPLIKQQRHNLVVELPAEPALVAGDQKRLVQIFTNLLDNAAKYTPQGGNIWVQMQLQHDQVTVVVKDNGIGIPVELQPYVFDLFAQGQRTSDRSQGGLGIGLALVKSLTEMHEGRVQCVSTGPGKGSLFSITLPRLLEAGDVTQQQQENKSARLTEKKLRILVVDDNVDAAMMLALLLEALGHEVLVEHASAKALERSQTMVPDVCILDIGLPEMDGHELARRLRQQSATRDATLIALTGYGQEQDRQNALAAGFDHHLAKPVDTESLIALLTGLPAL